ncbi:hypothetical protein GOBAR_AA07756 [Gossypium barbadense]|uniref:Uncharacterized protein n=1 Tax=Gossypium barbadense TaxID=3634 RepID=A0A2P5YBC0_GOSBA|nr:hypothetical protein GOBAR_AA07756 [Gossypium barbadense]
MSLTEILLIQSEKSMTGIPLTVDFRISPSSNSKSPSIASVGFMEGVEDMVLFPPSNLSFYETPLTGATSTTMFSTRLPSASLNLTFFVLRSSLEPSPSLRQPLGKGLESFIVE